MSFFCYFCCFLFLRLFQLIQLVFFSHQAGFNLHKDNEQELGDTKDVEVCALTVFINPQLDNSSWFMECRSDKDPTQSVVLPLCNGTFAYQPCGAQKVASHKSYGPQLSAPRCVIIFRKVLRGLYKQNTSVESINNRYKKQRLD